MPESRSQPAGRLGSVLHAFLGFVPLLASESDREVRWHASNGLLLFGAIAVFGGVATLIGFLIPPLSGPHPLVMLPALIVYRSSRLLATVKALEDTASSCRGLEVCRWRAQPALTRRSGAPGPAFGPAFRYFWRRFSGSRSATPSAASRAGGARMATAASTFTAPPSRAPRRTGLVRCRFDPTCSAYGREAIAAIRPRPGRLAHRRPAFALPPVRSWEDSIPCRSEVCPGSRF